MENVIAHRTGALFSHVAKGDGVIHDVTKTYVAIRYDDETLPEERVEIGRRYGVSTGYTIPQDIICDLPKGRRIAKGDVVAFNSGFFEREYMNPTQVTWKMGIPVTVAFVDTPDTFEDSSAISPRLANAMKIHTTEVRELTVSFENGIRNLVNVGQVVDSDSILCIIEDSITAGLDIFDERSIDTLSVMARNSPRAKADGVISKIEVLYNGDVEDMTETLRDVVLEADRLRSKRVKELKLDEARSGYASDIELDKAVIRIYIDSTEAAGDGDKGVLSHQLKTVIRRVLGANDRTESGRPLDVYFGYTSVANRIVGSAELMGTTATLARLRGQRAAKAYRSAKEKD